MPGLRNCLRCASTSAADGPVYFCGVREVGGRTGVFMISKRGSFSLLCLMNGGGSARNVQRRKLRTASIQRNKLARDRSNQSDRKILDYISEQAKDSPDRRND